MKLFYSDRFELPLPAEHRFPMTKYRRLRERVEAARLVPPEALVVPRPATDEELLRVHTPEYVAAVTGGTLDRAAIRRIGFPWSPELVERSRRSVGGTLGAAAEALDAGGGVNLAGGTHHAFAGHGAGFCVFNDVAVAARAALAGGSVGRVVILDGDVHQGDGTAAIFADEPAVTTVSIHGRANFPFRKQASDHDLALDDGAGDEEYARAVDRALELVAPLEAFDLAFYLAGADPYRGDRLGRLAVSRCGLARRDRVILEALRRARVPVAVVMSGGYAPRVEAIVDIHFSTVATAVELFGDRAPRAAAAKGSIEAGGAAL